MYDVTISDPAFTVAGATYAVDSEKFVPRNVKQRESILKNVDIGPQLFNALCAAGTHSQNTIYELLGSKILKFAQDIDEESLNNGQLRNKLRDYLDSYVRKVFDNTLARGHIDVADMGTYLLVGKDVPRLVSLFLCSPHYLSHEQQSLRYSEPSSFHIPSSLKNTHLGGRALKLIEDAYSTYKQLIEVGIPKEDARSLLPLAVNSNITTIGGGREFTYLEVVSKNKFVVLPQVVKESIAQILNSVTKIAPEVFKDRGPNYDIRRYYPAPQFFVSDNRLVSEAVKKSGQDKVYLLGFHDSGMDLNKEEIFEGVTNGNPTLFTNLLHVKAVFLVKFSLEAAHQAIRHRTWNHDFESLYTAAERFDYMVPPSIERSKFLNEYHRIVQSFYELYKNVRDEVSKSEAIIFLTNAHYIYDVVEIDGWNMIGNLPLRTCEKAQWEIRGIAKLMSSKIAWGSAESGFKGNKVMSFFTLPPCHTFNVCFEDNTKEVCPIYHHKFLKNQQKLTA
jgi:thymidylate synthase (FAD)